MSNVDFINFVNLLKEGRQDLTRELMTSAGLTMTVRYTHEDVFEKVRKQTDHIANPEARRQAVRKALRKRLAETVVDWDLTPEILGRYLPVDTSSLPQAIPCEPGIVEGLIETSDVFAAELQAAITDLSAFRAGQAEEERKN